MHIVRLCYNFYLFSFLSVLCDLCLIEHLLYMRNGRKKTKKRRSHNEDRYTHNGQNTQQLQQLHKPNTEKCNRNNSNQPILHRCSFYLTSGVNTVLCATLQKICHIISMLLTFANKTKNKWEKKETMTMYLALMGEHNVKKASQTQQQQQQHQQPQYRNKRDRQTVKKKTAHTTRSEKTKYKASEIESITFIVNRKCVYNLSHNVMGLFLSVLFSMYIPAKSDDYVG